MSNFFQTRNIKGSTVALEPVFWEKLDFLANKNQMGARFYVKQLLENKPDGQGRASYLRCCALEG